MLSYEFIRFYKLINQFKNIYRLYQKIFKLLVSKKISDNWKEKVLFRYSIDLFTVSIKIIIIISILILFFYIFDYFSNEFIKYILTFTGIVQMSLSLIIYHYLRIIYAKL